MRCLLELWLRPHAFDSLTLPARAEPCSLSGGCLDTAPSSNAAERLLHSQQQVLDLNQVPGVMAVGANTTLSLVNLRLNHIAYKTSFTPSQAQRYRTEGIGTGLWPSVQFAPDSKVSTSRL